jgi:hypothetical protein
MLLIPFLLPEGETDPFLLLSACYPLKKFGLQVMLAKLAILSFQQSRKDEKTPFLEVTEEVFLSSQPSEINVCNDHIESLSNRSDGSSANLDTIGNAILSTFLWRSEPTIIMVKPQTSLAPSLAATIERMPDPVPTSSTEALPPEPSFQHLDTQLGCRMCSCAKGQPGNDLNRNLTSLQLHRGPGRLDHNLRCHLDRFEKSFPALTPVLFRKGPVVKLILKYLWKDPLNRCQIATNGRENLLLSHALREIGFQLSPVAVLVDLLYALRSLLHEKV